MNLRPILWKLDTHLNYRARAFRASLRIAGWLPHWLRRAVIVDCAVLVTGKRPRDAYAGPDGITYEQMHDAA